MTDYAADLEVKRRALEAFTLASTWEQPFHEFEWAVTNDTLAHCSIVFDGDGNLFVSFLESDPHTHTLDDVIDHTLDLLRIGTSPVDRHDSQIDRHRIATALRAAADRVDREARALSALP